MGQIRKYLDASLIINVFSPVEELARRSLAIVNDAGLQFIVSDYLELETLPKMRFNKKHDQVEFTEALFRKSEYVNSSDEIVAKAKELASMYGLAAMDALHAASAIAAGADEFLTFEKSTKPLFRIPVAELQVVSLHGE
ncbi:MAG: PIN domain-containing protein [Spirochaetaceae bacterium]|jgi:predicted nucleic acid-binding protein|nr:PIN domain-containing protein [Spirochaetaceae bacterium]